MLLETIFDDRGLERLRLSDPEHPVVVRYDRLRTLTTGGSASPEEETDVVVDVALMAMDRSTWATDGHPADYWETLLGDAAKARIVRGMLANGDQFTDTLLELYYWGHLRRQVVDASLPGAEGLPDIQAGTSDDASWVECKRLRLGTGPTGARKALTKANAQLKRASPEKSGTVVIQVSRRHIAATFDDVLPPDVDACRRALELALASGRYTHTGAVVLIWDDFMVLGTPPERSLYAVRRRSLVIQHPAPIAPLPLSVGVLSSAHTVTMWVSYSDSSGPTAVEQGTRDIAGLATKLTDQFRDQSQARGGVRPSHARAALESPDGRDVLTFGDVRLLLFTKLVTLSVPPHVLLVLCTQRDDGPIEISQAFRLYGPSDIDAIAADPRAALMTLIARFGLPIDIGGRVALLHENALLKAQDSIHMPGVDALMASALVRRLPNGETEIAWAFALDSAAYLASLRAT